MGNSGVRRTSANYVSLIMIFLYPLGQQDKQFVWNVYLGEIQLVSDPELRLSIPACQRGKVTKCHKRLDSALIHAARENNCRQTEKGLVGRLFSSTAHHGSNAAAPGRAATMSSVFRFSRAPKTAAHARAAYPALPRQYSAHTAAPRPAHQPPPVATP